MSNFFVTPADADALRVTPIVDRVLISVMAGIKPSKRDTRVATAV